MNIDQLRQKHTADWPAVKRVLVLQGSPRGEKGWTDHCLTQTLAGLAEGGVSAEVVYLRQRKIKPCVGCFTCWEKTPGVCVHKGDDMPELLEKMASHDLLIYAQPLYYYSIPGLAKNFMDRCLPLVEPFLVSDPASGLTSHPHRHGGHKRVVLLSVCGFPEVAHFAALRQMFGQIFRGGDALIVGELLRPAAEAMSNRVFFQDRYDTAMAAFRQAGLDLARRGFVSQAVEEAAATPFFDDNELFFQMANLYWRASIAYNQAKGEGRDVGDFNAYFQAFLAKQGAGV